LKKLEYHLNLENTLATLNAEEDGVTYKTYRYNVRDTFGVGRIELHSFNGILISNRFINLVEDVKINKLVYNEDYYQLSFLLDGEIIFLLDDKKEFFFEGKDCFFLDFSGFQGAIKLSSKRPIHEVNIKIPIQYLNRQGILHDFQPKKLTSQKYIKPIANTIMPLLIAIQECKLQGCLKKIFLEAKLLEIVVLLADNYLNDAITAKADTTLKKLYVVKEVIEQDLSKNYSLKELALLAGMNEFELKKEFKRVFKTTVNKYVKSKKMKHADLLLKNTQETVYEIAEKIGYKNATHFSAAFKKYYGVTPKNVRNKQL
jgi:AraC-like DNA-binding protein